MLLRFGKSIVGLTSLNSFCYTQLLPIHKMNQIIQLGLKKSAHGVGLQLNPACSN